MHAVIVGGGVIGCAIARELGLHGVRVTVLERDDEPTGASRAAAGMLSPQAEAESADAFLDLLLESRRMYPAFAAALRAEVGAEVGYRDEGTLVVALTDADEEELRRRLEWQGRAGLPVEWLRAEEAHALEPALAPQVRGALRFSGDHQVDNRLLAPALRAAAERAGAVMRSGAAVTALRTESGRVEGVTLTGGEVVRADWVVVAAGAGAGRLDGLPRPLPVRPVHGQLLALRPARPALRHVVDSPRGYLVPRADGRLIVGATTEEIDFDQRVTAEGVRALVEAAVEMVPMLGQAALIETWSGHRPGTPDGWPILGPDPEVRGLVYATGHYRNGILLTPVTGRVIAGVVLGRGEADLRPFSVCRFGH